MDISDVTVFFSICTNTWKRCVLVYKNRNIRSYSGYVSVIFSKKEKEISKNIKKLYRFRRI